MIDFNKLNTSRSQSAPLDPVKIFQRLPKPPHINDLWESQSEALKLWTKRRSENDLVIKLNTGGGKTLVGLLIGQAILNELNQPVIYLCPNNQLVRQTADKATEIGITTVIYEAGPGDLSSEFLNGNAILIATYNAIFHGRSKFGVLASGAESIKVGGFICDDAHTAFSTVRDSFSISISRADQEDLYNDIASRFRTDFEEIGKIGSFDDIVERKQPEVLEVPYTAWGIKGEAIRNILARSYSETFRYGLPLLRNHFELCHVLISSRELNITPIQPLVHLLPSFDDCHRRVYMSATIADDSSIIRTFDAKPAAVRSPIIPNTLSGIGERMILAPSLTKIEIEDDLTIAHKLAKKIAKEAGVVVLVPSEKAAERWKGIAKFRIKNEVEGAISKLVSGSDHGPFVFANRYDGIDLIGNACRLLIMDGLPRGSNAYELFRAEVLQASSSLNISLAQKVEQGLGRATRGAGDYCVVLLTGTDLVSWISRNDSLNLMTPSSKAQVLMGHEISKSITKDEELADAITQCLKRDTAWTKYHAETLADRAESPTVDSLAIEAASIERDYTRSSVTRQFDQAAQLAYDFARRHHKDKKLRGWFLQLSARAHYFAKNVSRAKELQKDAYVSNQLLWAPPGMADIYTPTESVGNQAENIITQIAKFALPSGHLQDFETAVSILTPAATSNQLEEGLKRLGSFLGFHSERPEQEYGIGPDVLWLPNDDFGIIIESKGKKKPKNALGKNDHGQLLVSAEWFKQQYPERKCVRVQHHPNDRATQPSMAKNTYALTYENLDKLVSSVRAVLCEVCHAQVNSMNRLHLCEKMLKRNNLTPNQILDSYFGKFKIIDEDQG